MTIAVKYCGGCNPRYNRTALLNRLKGDFPQVAFATGAAALATADHLLVLCGCASRCAEIPPRTGSQGCFVMKAAGEYPALTDWVKSVL